MDSESQKQALAKMEQAFADFHAAIMQLQGEQRDVISEIQNRIDQKKIQDIHSLLQQSQR